MIHNVRINGEVKEIDCELGSGIKDKNGREFFEGDTVKIIDDKGNGNTAKIIFKGGALAARYKGSQTADLLCVLIPLAAFNDKVLQVVK